MKVKEYSGFIRPKYKPKPTDFITELYVNPARGVSFKEACSETASESSVGTWTSINTSTKRIETRLKAKVFYLNKKNKIAKIAYPYALFEEGNIPQVLSSIAGNIYGMKSLKSLRLEDIDFPSKYMKSFKGPRYGIPGVRKITKVKKRPLVGTIVKPKLGLTEKQHAKVAYDAWTGGCDIVKDDENLSSQRFNKFERRVKETLKLRDKAEKETGERKFYMPNVTGETLQMLKRAEFVKKHGSEYAMVDIITCGWSALQTLRNENPGLILHAHRAGHGMFTENPYHGMSMLTVAKISRLIGVDQIHVGAVVGKMKGGKKEIRLIGENIEKRIIRERKDDHVLAENWGNLKPVFAVCSGGLHPGKTEALMNAMSRDIIIQMGGGIHGHPRGTVKGAAAARQSVDAIMEGYTLKEYAKSHRELAEALKKWGTN